MSATTGVNIYVYTYIYAHIYKVLSGRTGAKKMIWEKVASVEDRTPAKGRVTVCCILFGAILMFSLVRILTFQNKPIFFLVLKKIITASAV